MVMMVMMVWFLLTVSWDITDLGSGIRCLCWNSFFSSTLTLCPFFKTDMTPPRIVSETPVLISRCCWRMVVCRSTTIARVWTRNLDSNIRRCWRWQLNDSPQDAILWHFDGCSGHVPSSLSATAAVVLWPVHHGWICLLLRRRWSWPSQEVLAVWDNIEQLQHTQMWKNSEIFPLDIEIARKKCLGIQLEFIVPYPKRPPF